MSTHILSPSPGLKEFLVSIVNYPFMPWAVLIMWPWTTHLFSVSLSFPISRH